MPLTDPLLLGMGMNQQGPPDQMLGGGLRYLWIALVAVIVPIVVLVLYRLLFPPARQRQNYRGSQTVIE